MKILELFAGTRSVGKAFERHGHEVFSVEWDKQFENIDLYGDVLNVQYTEIMEKFGKPDVIWASPDCTTYSISAISHHRTKEDSGNLKPISEYAKYCDRVNQHMLCLILALSPMYWFIENPRGGMRKMDFMNGLPRYTVTYCQYGDIRMKPTDIWTNHPNPQFKPPCRNGDSCHQSAPRGAKTGTQGLKGSLERSRIPRELCEHIVKICEWGCSTTEDSSTVPTSSKMEQVPNCIDCTHYGDYEVCKGCDDDYNKFKSYYEPKDEPQTERSGVLFRGELEEGDYRLIKTTDGWVLQGEDIVFCGWERSE